MIIFGWKSLARIVSSGSFVCPRCGGKRWYSVVSVRRWFTLFFVPLIPLGKLGSYVECRSCGSTYNQGVLRPPRSASATSAEAAVRPRHGVQQSTQASSYSTTDEAVRRLLVSVSLADGEVTADEAALLIAIAQDYLPYTYRFEDLLDDIAAFADDDVLATTRSMRQLSGTLSKEGRELLLHAAAFLSACDGEIHRAEIKMLNDMAGAFGLSRHQVGRALELARASLAREVPSEEPF